MKKLIVLSFLIVIAIGVYGQRTINGYGYSSGGHYCEDGVLFVHYGSDTMLVKFPQNKNVSSYTIPNGIKVISKGAFQDNKYIRTIRIPSTVTNIGDNAFDGCDQLTSIEVYESTNAARAVEADNSPSEAREVGRYNIQGVKIQEDEDGQVQIILYSDGTTQKVIK